MGEIISDAVLEGIGNVGYVHQPRFVFFDGLVKTRAAVMKMYSMVKDEHPNDRQLISDLGHFLSMEAMAGRIPQESGLGFTIISDGMINATVWGKDSSIVMKNRLWTFDQAHPLITASPVDTNKEGTYCIWEEKIVDFERDAWLEFLKAGRTTKDKRKYLARYFQGKME